MSLPGLSTAGWGGNESRSVHVAHGDKPSGSIARSSAVPKTEAKSDLERDLRTVCERGGRLTHELAQDVLFWLDLGREPRDVARWLRHELQDAAQFSTTPDETSSFSHDEDTAETERRASWTRKQKHTTRHLFVRRAIS
jgi:hypothetical protein